jgi:hypothetical protein
MGATSETERDVENPSTPSTSPAIDNDTLELQVQQATKGLFFLIVVQTSIALVALFTCGLMLSMINLFFTFFAIIGMAHRRHGFLAIHLAYSVMLLIVSLVFTIRLIFYSFDHWLPLFACFLATQLQAVGIRMERRLICLIVLQKMALTPVPSISAPTFPASATPTAVAPVAETSSPTAPQPQFSGYAMPMPFSFPQAQQGAAPVQMYYAFPPAPNPAEFYNNQMPVYPYMYAPAQLPVATTEAKL